MPNHLVYFWGIDPGVNGGLSLYSPVSYNNTGVTYLHSQPMPDTPKGIWQEISAFLPGGPWDREMLAVVEEQLPRPTRWDGEVDGKKVHNSTVLASTSILYGNYTMILGMLTAANIPYVCISPRKWQARFGMKRTKEETNSQWKGRLKDEAQRIFPSEKVTLKTADSLLLVEYARIQWELGCRGIL